MHAEFCTLYFKENLIKIFIIFFFQKNTNRPSTSKKARAPAKIHKEVLLTLGGDDDDDDDDLVVRQLQIKEAKGPIDPNNIINIAKRNKNLSKMEICELFAEIVKRLEMCDTFNLEFVSFYFYFFEIL